jgi:hypothetical protein
LFQKNMELVANCYSRDTMKDALMVDQWERIVSSSRRMLALYRIERTAPNMIRSSSLASLQISDSKAGGDVNQNPAVELTGLLADCLSAFRSELDQRCCSDRGGKEGASLPNVTSSASIASSLSSSSSSEATSVPEVADPPLAQTTVYAKLLRVLNICSRIAERDYTLSEELGRQGSHALLKQLLSMDPAVVVSPPPVHRLEEATLSDEEAVMELQDVAAGIAATFSSASTVAGKFPLPCSPFSLEDIRGRLPLSFAIVPIDGSATASMKRITSDSSLSSILSGSNSVDSLSVADEATTVLINQVSNIRQSAQQDVGFGAFIRRALNRFARPN